MDAMSLVHAGDGSGLLTDMQIVQFLVEPGWRFGRTFVARWSEVDAFGHVNHKTHLTWCEEVRNAYLAAAGYPVSDARHAGPVLREVSCAYEKPLALAQTVLVTARTDWIGRSSFRMSYAVWHDGLVARSNAVCIWYLNEAFSTEAVPADLRHYMCNLDAAEDRNKAKV